MEHHTQLILFHVMLIPSRTAMTAVIYGQCQSSYGRHLTVINDFCWYPWRIYTSLLFYVLVQPKYLGWERNICYCFGSAALRLNFQWISKNCDSFHSPPHDLWEVVTNVISVVYVWVVVCSGIYHRLHSSWSAEYWNNKVSHTQLAFNCFF